MKTSINDYELNHLFSYIKSEYKIFGNKKKSTSVVFDELKNYSELTITTRQNVIPFKKILFPDNLQPESKNQEKIALFNLHSCDLHALHRLSKEFSKNDLLVERKNLLIIGTDCFPDSNCFCDLTRTNDPKYFDLYIQNEKYDKYSIFSGSVTGEKILKKLKFKEIKDVEIVPLNITGEEKINLEELKEIISNRTKNEELWQKLSKNCFGCGACSIVCPLCFCTRQNFDNTLDGDCKLCLKWDSCFGKRFSEIQNRNDMRPDNADRFYNWYHHKFVRAPFQNQQTLCTGCGRCITACPANLNIKNIISTFIKKDRLEK